MTVLVTGGLGFIGSHLVRRLVAEGEDVHVFGLGLSRNVSDVLGSITVHRIDIRNSKALESAVAKISPSRIFHLAANVNVSRSVPLKRMMADNFDTTAALLKSLEQVDYDSFVHAGTCEEYGNGPVPFRESQKPIAVSPYSESKIKATEFCIDYHNKTGKPVTVLRPFLAYGPFQQDRMLIPYVITSALLNRPMKTTKGEQTREFNYVSDIVDGFVLASRSRKAAGEVINIGNGKEYKIRDVIRKMLGIMGSDVPVDDSLPYREGEAMRFYCSNEKAHSILGWEPKVGLDEGLGKTIKWYEEKHASGELRKWMSGS